MPRTFSGKQKRAFRAAALIAALLVFAAAVFLLSGEISVQTRCDDIDAILASYDAARFNGMSIEDDGTVLVELEKADIYWYADKCGLLDQFRSHLDSLRFFRNADFGFRITDDQITFYVTRRLAGAFPVSYRIILDVKSSGTELSLIPVSVIRGTNRVLPESRWPSVLPERISLDLKNTGVLDQLEAAWTDGNALILRESGLLGPGRGSLKADSALLEAFRIFGTGPLDDTGAIAWLLDCGEEDVDLSALRSLVTESADPEKFLTEMLACCTSESRTEMWASSDSFTLNFVAAPLEKAAGARRTLLLQYLEPEQNRYEKLLTAPREMYKAGSLMICRNVFQFVSTRQKVDPSSFAKDLSATATDCRLVFLYSDNGSRVCTDGMPVLGSVPRLNRKSLDVMDINRVYDLGMVLTSENGVPVLLHYQADGVFVVHELTMDDYIAMLVKSTHPVLDPGTLPEGKPLVRTGADGEESVYYPLP